jgi:hypothetical protein
MKERRTILAFDEAIGHSRLGLGEAASALGNRVQ